MEALGYGPPGIMTGARMPSPVFRSPINAPFQANILSGSFHSQQQAHNNTTYVDESTIIGGTPIENNPDNSSRTKTSEVD